MAEQEKRAARPVRAFLQRLGVQIVISGSAMATIHFGTGVLPSLGALFGPERETISSAEKPSIPEFAAVPVAAITQLRPADPIPNRRPVEASTQAPPVPEPAPPRPVRLASAEKAAIVRKGGVQRFDACSPACPSQDPLLKREDRIAASPIPTALPVIGRGTEFPEVPDAAADRSDSVLAVPGRVLASAGHTTRGVLIRVGNLLPF